MRGNVAYLPVWKKGATAEERFLELAQMAAAHPERFARTVVVYQEDLPDDMARTRYVSSGGKACEILGLLEMGKAELHQWMQGD